MKTRVSIYRLLIWSAALCCNLGKAATMSASLALGSDILSAETSYTFTVQVNTPLQTSNHFIFAFDATLGVEIPNSLSTCAGLTGFTDSNIPCVKLSETEVRVGCFSCDLSAYPTYSIRIENIKNSPSALTTIESATVATYEGSTQIDSSNEIPLQFDFIVLASSAGSISSDSPTVGQEETLRLTLKLGTDVPAGGQVEIILPKWVTVSMGASSNVAMVTSSILQSCTSTQSGSPTCSVTAPSGATTDTVTISNAFSSSASGGTSVTVTVQKVRNPPSLQAVDGFAINILDSAGNYINKCSGLTLQMTSVYEQESIGESSVDLTGDTAPSREGTYAFDFETTLPIPIGGSLRLKLPSAIDLPEGGLSSVRVTSTSNMSSNVSLSTGTSSREIIFNNAFSSIFVDAEETVQFSLEYLRNPTDNTSTDSFEISTYDAAGNGIESLDFGLSIKALSGTLKNVKFGPIEEQSNVYLFASDFNLSFTLDNDFMIGSDLILDVISKASGEFSLVSDQKCTVTSTTHTVSSSVDCQLYASQQRIVISNLASSRIRQDSDVELLLSDMTVRNPSSTRSKASVFLYTSLNDQTIDSGYSTGFEATPQRLLSASVSTSSLVSSHQNTEYTFTIRPSGPIPQYATIKVVFPSDIEISSTRAIESDCAKYQASGLPLKRGRTPSFNCDVIDDNKSVRIERLFAYGSASDYATVEFTLPGIQNPRLVFQESESIKIFVYEDDAMRYQIYNETDLLTVTMTTPYAFSYLKVEPESTKNRAVTDYRITVEGVMNSQTEDILEIQFPKQVKVGSSVECRGDSYQLSPLLQCETDTDLNQVTIFLAIVNWGGILRDRRQLFTGVQKFQFVLTSVSNAATTAPSDPFGFKITTSEGTLTAENTSMATVATDSYFTLSSFAFEARPIENKLSAETDYRISLTLKTYVPGMWLELKLPSQITVVDKTAPLQCLPISEHISANLTCEFNAETEIITVKDGFDKILYEDEIGLVFSIGPLRNPNEILVTDSFELETKIGGDDDQVYLIDGRSIDLVINFTCLSPCKTCLEGTNDVCESCITDDPDAPSLLHEGTCIKECPLFSVSVTATATSESAEVLKTCSLCFDSSCERCSGPSEADLCESCSQPKILYDGACLTQDELPKEIVTVVETSDVVATPVSAVVVEEKVEHFYVFPFILMAFVWTLASTVLVQAKRHRPVYFLPTVIPGVVLISTALAIFEGIWVYRDNKLVTHANTALVVAFALSFCVQIAYLIVFLKSLNKQASIREYFSRNKKSSIPILVLSFVINYRMLKLSYTNLSANFDLEVLRVENNKPGWTPRRLNMLFSTFMMVVDVILCFNAISAIFTDTEDDIVTKVCIERVAVSIMLAICTLMEFIIPSDDQRQDLNPNDKEQTRHLGMILPVQMEPEAENRLPYSKIVNMSTTSMITATDAADTTTTQPLYKEEDWGTSQFASNQALLRPSMQDRFRLEADENAQQLTRSTSAEGKRDGAQRMSRFIKRSSMFAISERGSEEDEAGYLSDPYPVQNEQDLKKLYEVVPDLKNGLGVPVPLRDIKQKLEYKSLERLDSSTDPDHINWEKELNQSSRVNMDSLVADDKDDGEQRLDALITQFSSDHRNSVHNNIIEQHPPVEVDVEIQETSQKKSLKDILVLHSDKSESSIADQMDVSPADFNEQNMRYNENPSSILPLQINSVDDSEPDKMISPSLTFEEAPQNTMIDSKIVKIRQMYRGNRKQKQSEDSTTSTVDICSDSLVHLVKKSNNILKGKDARRQTSVIVKEASLEGLLPWTRFEKTPSSRSISLLTGKLGSTETAYKPTIGAAAGGPQSVRSQYSNSNSRDSRAKRRLQNSKLVSQLILGRNTGYHGKTQRLEDPSGNNILYNASFRPHYYGMHEFIENVDTVSPKRRAGSNDDLDHLDGVKKKQ